MSFRSFSRLPILSRFHITSPTTITKPTPTLTSPSSTPRRTLNTTSSKMATNQRSAAAQEISEVAKQEGGTTKGSTSAKMQSQLTKQGNLDNGPQSSGANAGRAPAEQSQLDREANFDDAANKVGTKMATEPENVTKEDGDLMHSRETKAFGATEKGGLASQAQSQAAKNAGDTA